MASHQMSLEPRIFIIYFGAKFAQNALKLASKIFQHTPQQMQYKLRKKLAKSSHYFLIISIQ
jgi:hypothetical protein